MRSDGAGCKRANETLAIALLKNAPLTPASSTSAKRDKDRLNKEREQCCKIRGGEEASYKEHLLGEARALTTQHKHVINQGFSKGH